MTFNIFIDVDIWMLLTVAMRITQGWHVYRDIWKKISRKKREM